MATQLQAEKIHFVVDPLKRPDQQVPLSMLTKQDLHAAISHTQQLIRGYFIGATPQTEKDSCFTFYCFLVQGCITPNVSETIDTE